MKAAARSFRLYGYASVISLTGSLPIGTLNAGIAGLVISRQVVPAVLFGLGALLVEVGLVRMALVAIKRLEGLNHFSRWFRLLGCIVILLFAFISLNTAWHAAAARPTDPIIGESPFISGIVLSLLNPLHLPFWMGWTTVLKAKGLLSDTRREYNIYVLAIGMGTGIAFLVYGITGQLLIRFLLTNQNLFNWLTGIALFVTGLVQVWKLLRR